MLQREQQSSLGKGYRLTFRQGRLIVIEKGTAALPSEKSRRDVSVAQVSVNAVCH